MSVQATQFYLACKTLHFKCSLDKLSQFRSRVPVSPVSGPVFSKLQIPFHNSAPYSTPAAQHPTVRTAACGHQSTHKLTPVDLHFSSSQIEDTKSRHGFKEDSVLSCCHFCPEDRVLTLFLYNLIYGHSLSSLCREAQQPSATWTPVN